VEFDLSTQGAHADPEFVAAVRRHQAKGGWWQAGQHLNRLEVDGLGRVLFWGLAPLVDSLGDEYNVHLRGVWRPIG